MESKIIVGDALTELRGLPEESVNCVVTSPPYYALRDYGDPNQIGLEKTPWDYVDRMRHVFREVRRVLRSDGTLWLVLGDCYVSSGGPGWQGKHGARANRTHTQRELKRPSKEWGIKPKNLLGMPWRVAFALQDDGWVLRRDIIWHKKNPTPESVKDRPTASHEYVFLFAKSKRYLYDHESVREPCTSDAYDRRRMKEGRKREGGKYVASGISRTMGELGKSSKVGGGEYRSLRDVWSLSSRPFHGAHFATFPPTLVEPCIKAGCPKGGIVLDPFFGAGTVGLVASRLGRDFIGIEISATNARLARQRLIDEGCSQLEFSPDHLVN